jgi:hypothetical protein
MALSAGLKKAVAAGLVGWLACTGGQGVAREGRSAVQPIRRAKPPASAWDRTTTKIFLADAFKELDGERPDFVAATKQSATAGASQSGAATASAAGGFKWSALASEDTLTDEIKDMKAVLTGVVASQSDFKGGGYDKAR